MTYVHFKAHIRFLKTLGHVGPDKPVLQMFWRHLVTTLEQVEQGAAKKDLCKNNWNTIRLHLSPPIHDAFLTIAPFSFFIANMSYKRSITEYTSEYNGASVANLLGGSTFKSGVERLTAQGG